VTVGDPDTAWSATLISSVIATSRLRSTS